MDAGHGSWAWLQSFEACLGSGHWAWVQGILGSEIGSMHTTSFRVVWVQDMGSGHPFIAWVQGMGSEH
jgi:hypothetical protein